MSKTNKAEVIKRLQSLKNVGPAMAEELYRLGIKSPEQMKKTDPEKLFARLKKVKKGADPCELYIFRGAVLNKPWWKCKNIPKG